MANLLFLSAIPDPFLEDHGGKQRLVRLLYAVAKRHKVTLLSLSWDGKTFHREIAPNLIQISVAVESKIQRRAGSGKTGLLNPNQDLLISHFAKQFKTYIKLLNELSFANDLIVVDHFSTAPLISFLKNKQVPIFYSSQNCEAEYIKQNYPMSSYDFKLISKTEGNILKRAEAFSYCSREDLTKIEEFYDLVKKSFYIPNGSNVPSGIRSSINHKSKNIIFIGSGHQPNIVAARKILDLAEKCPNYDFIVAGTCAINLPDKGNIKNLSIKTEVTNEDVKKLFEEAFIFINPMESGSGTHVKMMMALSYGLPIVTSTVGARGFTNKEREDCMFIADSYLEMQNAILLLTNENCYREKSENCIKLAKVYDWDLIGENFVDALETLLYSGRTITL